ncbi:hypothetical protein GCM10011390_45190 [Aureimonas endophytica]|uniref:Uncharacterized protein n=1 Tax=Aureimonas endophytica TaxID=2027858 RepID=A0A917A226_9HYPH|nr:hypothetical protein GCM10011390_45190 [Aureimonas endophytica]
MLEAYPKSKGCPLTSPAGAIDAAMDGQAVPGGPERPGAAPGPGDRPGGPARDDRIGDDQA